MSASLLLDVRSLSLEDAELEYRPPLSSGPAVKLVWSGGLTRIATEEEGA
jgi:hypothetical protein